MLSLFSASRSVLRNVGLWNSERGMTSQLRLPDQHVPTVRPFSMTFLNPARSVAMKMSLDVRDCVSAVEVEKAEGLTSRMPGEFPRRLASILVKVNTPWSSAVVE